MKKLIAREWNNGRLEKWWLHVGEDGNDRITIETVQDVEPVMDAVKRKRDEADNGDFRFKARIPGTIVEEVCRNYSKTWGVKFDVAWKEIMQAKTDRAQGIWKMLSESRDYMKFQRKGYV